jgi:hypothetical protein
MTLVKVLMVIAAVSLDDSPFPWGKSKRVVDAGWIEFSSLVLVASSLILGLL